MILLHLVLEAGTSHSHTDYEGRKNEYMLDGVKSGVSADEIK